MRVRLSEKDRDYLFTELDKKGLGMTEVAEVVNISTRTLTSWKQGRYTMPKEHFEKLMALAKVDSKLLNPETLNQWWSNSDAGKKGASVRFAKHGHLGSHASRQLGGRNSYLSRRSNLNDIFTPKDIFEPVENKQLAEFMGVLIGDGGVTKYQVSIACNAKDDSEYVIYVASLVRQLFGMEPSILQRKSLNCTLVVASSVKLVDYLKGLGIFEGDKLRQSLDIPAWILRDRGLAIACLRGIFDTDGCVFLERHKIKSKYYSYPRLSFVSMSANLRESIYKVLADLEFTPKVRNNRSVNLEKLLDIQGYFKVVGTSNPKHLDRWNRFGGVG